MLEPFFAQIDSRQPGATEAEIAEIGRTLGAGLPQDYLDVLRESNGLDGHLKGGAYLLLYSVREVIDLTLERREMAEEIGNLDAQRLVLVGVDGNGSPQIAFDGRSWLPVDNVELENTYGFEFSTFTDLLENYASRFEEWLNRNVSE